MKLQKRLITLFFVFVMVVSLAACQTATETPTEVMPTEETVVETETPVATEMASTDPLEMITEGRYVMSFTAEGYGDYTFYFHFYKDIPVLGDVFYAGFSNNGTNFAGTYSVEETPIEVAVYTNREDKLADLELTPETVPYTITFFDWDGNEIGKVGYDGDVLYNVMEEEDVIYASGSGTQTYNHDVDGEFQEIYDGEVGVPYVSLVADDEKTSTLDIYHNQTYADLVGALVEGTWDAEENSDGGIDFTLTPNDSMDTGAVVSVAADKSTAVYTPDGGDPIAMTNASLTGPQLSYLFEGVITVEEYSMDADLALSAFDDGSCQLTGDIGGSVVELDSCTYELNDYTFNFDFNAAEDASSDVDAEGTMTVPVILPGTPLGDIDTVMTLNKDAVVAEAQIVQVFAGVFTLEDYGVDADIVMNLYDDNNLEVVASVAGNNVVVDEGTYELDEYTFMFDFNSAEDATSEIDGSGTITVPFVITGTEMGDIDTVLTRVAE